MRARTDLARARGLAFALTFALAVSAASGCATGAVGSIGVYARREPSSGRIVVSEVPPGGAGARSGLQPGDEIVTVDGVAVRSMSKPEFQGAVRGAVGSSVVLVVRRDNTLQTITVVRGPIEIKER